MSYAPAEVRRAADRHQAAHAPASSGDARTAVASPACLDDDARRAATRPSTRPRTPLARRRSTGWRRARRRAAAATSAAGVDGHRASRSAPSGSGPATSTPPCPAPAPTARRSPPTRSPPARSPCSPTPDGRGAARPASASRCSSSTGPARVARRPRRPRLRRPAPRAAADRRHRHPGQDHHHPARRERPAARPACRAAVIGTVGTRIAGARRQDRADHPGGARPARAVRGDARARRRRPARWRSPATRW